MTAPRQDKKGEFENLYKESGGNDNIVETRKSLLLQQTGGKKIKLKLKTRAPSTQNLFEGEKSEKKDKPYSDV